MNFVYRLLLLFFIVSQCFSLNGQCPNMKTDVRTIRKRRHLYWPDGSTASCTISLAKAFMTHVPSGWYLTSDLDALYPLPNKDFINKQMRKKLHHRQKREFWERIKEALNLHNMNGHACVLRSICEAETHLAPPGKSLVHDLLRAMLTAPLDEEEFKEEMGEMFGDLSDPKVCERMGECPFSIVNFLLAFNEPRRY